MTTQTLTSETGSFDLTTQPWIQLHMLDGSVIECSLREVFRLAPQARAVVGEISTMTFALTRLLLAILHRAVGGPADIAQWSELWAATELPTAQTDAYLDHVADRFDLLHPVTPFYQVAALRSGKDGMGKLEKLIADVPDNLPYFTTRSGSALKSISYAEAARWLVHAQAYETGGIKTGAVGDSRVKLGKGFGIGAGWCGNLGGILIERANLREALLLNLIADSYSLPAADDVPMWERPPQTSTEEVSGGRIARGMLDAYTWQKARIRLETSGGRVTGVLMCNGDRADLVNQHQHEPMTAWSRNEDHEKRHGVPLAYTPTRHDPTRAMWRGITSLMASRSTLPSGTRGAERVVPGVIGWLSKLRDEEVLPANYIVSTHAFGVQYNDDNKSKLSEVVDDKVSVNVVVLTESSPALGEQIEQAVKDTASLVRYFGDLAADVAVAIGGDPKSPKKEAMDAAYSALDAPFRRWLADLRPDSDPLLARTVWDETAQSVVRELAKMAVETAPAAATTGRTVAGRNGKKRRVCTAVAENDLGRKVWQLYHPQDRTAPIPKKKAI